VHEQHHGELEVRGGETAAARGLGREGPIEHEGLAQVPRRGRVVEARESLARPAEVVLRCVGRRDPVIGASGEASEPFGAGDRQVLAGLEGLAQIAGLGAAPLHEQDDARRPRRSSGTRRGEDREDRDDEMTGAAMTPAAPGRRPTLAQALQVVMDVARALDSAHRMRDDAEGRIGVIHRDVSPANILVSRDGVVKLALAGSSQPPEQSRAHRLVKVQVPRCRLRLDLLPDGLRKTDRADDGLSTLSLPGMPPPQQDGVTPQLWHLPKSQ
jgi:hypothetical protein